MSISSTPVHVSFGTAVITPRWLYVLAGATPAQWGDPIIADETLEPFDVEQVSKGDVVGIGIHTGNALPGLRGRAPRARARCLGRLRRHPCDALPARKRSRVGGAHAVVKGDGDVIWGEVLEDCAAGKPQQVYEAGRVDGEGFARGAVGPAAAATVPLGVGADRARVPEALLVLLGLADRRAGAAPAVGGRRHRGSRRAAATRLPLHRARRRQLLPGLAGRPRRGRAPRRPDAPAARSRPCARSASSCSSGCRALPSDMVFFTQITMEAAEDPSSSTPCARRASRAPWSASSR